MIIKNPGKILVEFCQGKEVIVSYYRIVKLVFKLFGLLALYSSIIYKLANYAALMLYL